MRATIPVLTLALLTILAIPAATASDLPTGTRIEGNCIVLWDFPDEGFALCHSNPDCPGGLYTRRTTFIGTEERCVL